MNREKLKELGLEDEQIESVMAEHGKTVQSLNDKISTLEESENELKRQSNKFETDLKKLKKDNSGNENLKDTIKTLQKENDDAKKAYDKKLVEIQRNSALDKALGNSKAKNTKALRALLDNEKIVYKDGELSGVSEQIEALKESDPYLFDMGTKGGGYNPGKGNPPKSYGSFEEAMEAEAVDDFLKEQAEQNEKGD